MSPCVDVLLSCDELRQSIMILQGTLTCCSTGLTVPCRPCPHNFHKRILIVKRLIMTLARLIPEPHLVGYITGGLAQCRNHSHAIFMKFFRKYTYKHVYLHEKMLHYMSVESCFHGKSVVMILYLLYSHYGIITVVKVTINFYIIVFSVRHMTEQMYQDVSSDIRNISPSVKI